MKNNKILIFDFDGTLTPHPITKFEILEKCGISGGVDNPELWNLIRKRKQKEKRDFYVAVYEEFLAAIGNAGLPLDNDSLSLGAERIEYNNGALEFLRNLYKEGIDCYLLSSSIKVLLEKTIVAKYFSDIYATTFKYDGGKIVGVGDTVSDRKKVDVIREIMKNNGKKDCSDMIYVGDGLTDLYAMEYVKNNGGTSVFVYLDEESNELKSAKKQGVVDYFAVADYTNGSELNNYLKRICNLR